MAGQTADDDDNTKKQKQIKQDATIIKNDDEIYDKDLEDLAVGVDGVSPKSF